MPRPALRLALAGLALASPLALGGCGEGEEEEGGIVDGGIEGEVEGELGEGEGGDD